MSTEPPKPQPWPFRKRLPMARWAGVVWSVRHLAYGVFGKDAVTGWRRTAGEEHAAEVQPVVRGAGETAVAESEGRAPAPLAVGAVEEAEAGGAGAVVAGEAVALGGLDDEAGVGHVERLEQPLGQKLRQFPP